MKFIIPQKQSNSGSIYDLASDQHERVIKINSNHKFIVITPAYFNMQATRHSTESGAVKAYKALHKQGYTSAVILRLFHDVVSGEIQALSADELM